ncbi:MAG: ABC transporter substrate-binding protein [Actinomycetota bacterium]|nr:ABC transporter substrate-binding protein [Actinomycetota bacterium]
MSRLDRQARVIALAAIACLAVSSCGSRVVPLSIGTQAPGLPGVPLPGGVPTGLGGSPLPGATNGVPGANPSAPPGVPIAKNCKAADTGKERGVTKTTIKLGLVASIHGPLPGQFDSAVQATDSYFDMINDLGGICGRKVQLLIRDDQGNADVDKSVSEELATEDKIFSFVGSVAAPHDEGIGDASKKYKIPDIGFPLSSRRSKSPYTYGVPGQLQDRTIGTGASGTAYLNKRFGIQQVAMFWLDESDVSRLNAWGFETAMQKVTGGKLKFCYEQRTTVIDPSFTQYVINMQSACDPRNGPVAVYTTMENNSNIKLALAMRDQDFKPAVFAPTLASYLQTFISQAQGSTEGAYIALPQIPFEHLNTPQNTWSKGTYSLAAYIQALQRYHPDYVEPGSFGAPGWGIAQLFTEAAVECGSVLTRTCLLAKLDAMGPFSANGMLSPSRPGTHLIYVLESMVQVKGKRFVEVEHPGVTGPKDLPDFWQTDSQLFDWWGYYCTHSGDRNGKHYPNYFTNTAQKDRYIHC